MRLYSWRQISLSFTVLVFGLFFPLNIVAMILYPGSIKLDPTTVGYSFTHNFFSDLGRTMTYSGESNFSSSGVFLLSLVLVGLGLISFCFTATSLLQKNRTSATLGKLGLLAGIVSVISIPGIGFTPHNLYPETHTYFTETGFRSFLVLMLLYTGAIWKNENGIPKKIATTMIGFAVLVAIYIGIMEWGPEIDTTKGLIFQVISQKIIVFALIGCILIQSIQLLKFLKNTDKEKRNSFPA